MAILAQTHVYPRYQHRGGRNVMPSLGSGIGPPKKLFQSFYEKATVQLKIIPKLLFPIKQSFTIE